MTPGGPLDEGISWEPGMPPQLGKSILLLPTAASSDSFRSKIQFTDVARREVVLDSKKKKCFNLRYIEEQENLSHNTISMMRNLKSFRPSQKE